MVVRGAPAIGVTGALALAVHLISGGRGKQYSSVQACLDDIAATMDYLVTRWGHAWHSQPELPSSSVMPV
jgi:methylthioribose-1-phosphate isomerase